MWDLTQPWRGEGSLIWARAIIQRWGECTNNTKLEMAADGWCHRMAFYCGPSMLPWLAEFPSKMSSPLVEH